jgi:hypothetical protein
MLRYTIFFNGLVRCLLKCLFTYPHQQLRNRGYFISITEGNGDITRVTQTIIAWVARNINKMRDLLFKNLTSVDNKRKVLACAEIVDSAGVRTIVRRHFIYMVKEIKQKPAKMDEPYLLVEKVHDTKRRIERFFCKMKGSMIASYSNRLYHIRFMHTLNITLCALPNGIMKYTSDESI